MSVPVVAIVGRPNVGKSALFNWLAGRRISIVDPTAGVTRDRVSTVLALADRYYELCDTGGMGIVDVDDLAEDVERQIRYAIDAASVVLFVVDIRDGLMPLDHAVAERLRGVRKPVIFVANKADDRKFAPNAVDFLELGYGEPLLVSAEQYLGRDDLLEAILEQLPPDDGGAPPVEADLKVALVGRRNVGKSTFINSLAQADRVIVSEIPGTTRDSVDVRFERDGRAFVAIDTAGVRKKKSLASDIEYYSLHRAERSIRRADVVLLMFDPRLRISRVDKQLAEYVLLEHKPVVFVINKWDLAKDTIPTGKWADYLRQIFPMLDYVPIAFTTANVGKNVYRLLNLAQQLHKQANRRAKTGDLNRVLREAMLANAPPSRQNKTPKLYYATQISVSPPTVVLVTNGPDLFDPPYVRYLTKTLRDNFQFREVPIRLILKSKGEAAGAGGQRDVVVLDTPGTGRPDETAILPALAGEPPADALVPVRLEEPARSRGAVTRAEPTEVREKPRRKKKPGPGTWNL